MQSVKGDLYLLACWCHTPEHADPQAHNASPCDTLWACRSPIKWPVDLPSNGNKVYQALKSLTPWCLPLATVYKCICKVLYFYLLYTVILFYYVIIIIIIIIFYFIQFFVCFVIVCVSVPLLCHLPYALPGCAMYLPMLTFNPCYHLYSVMLYNVCCLPKGLMKME